MALSRWHGGIGFALPMQETQVTRVPCLGWEDPLEEEMATCSSILAWKISMDRGAWWATGHGASKESETTEHAHAGRIKFVFLC